MDRKETRYEIYVKRPIDFAGACVAVILLAVPMTVVAVGVRINLGKPVLYGANRIGKGEKPFRMYKFRSMTDERDSSGNLLPDEERMTKFGSFLRSSSLDELPEIFSILKGDMAFIGPRPMPVEYLPYISEEESIRHSCRGGMSGLAQVNGRTSITWDQKFAYDVEYVNNMSFRQDVRIFFKTLRKVFERDDIGIRNQGTNIDLYAVRDIKRSEFCSGN